MTDIVGNDDYLLIINELQQICSEMKNDVILKANAIMLSGYWRIGARLNDVVVNLKAEVKAVKPLFVRIAGDLGLEYTTLHRCMRFYQLWHDGCPASRYPQVNWTHYKVLMGVEHDEAREYYMDEVNTHHWNTRMLTAAIKGDVYGGRERAQGKESEGMILERRGSGFFRYTGIVEKVVDGDTLVVKLDLGFHVWFDQRMRLRGIDAPERNTSEGEDAKAFVVQKVGNNERVVIDSYWVDVYGRYVCDVMYLPGETQREKILSDGYFLNQQLLDSGHATLL